MSDSNQLIIAQVARLKQASIKMLDRWMSSRRYSGTYSNDPHHDPAHELIELGNLLKKTYSEEYQASCKAARINHMREMASKLSEAVQGYVGDLGSLIEGPEKGEFTAQSDMLGPVADSLIEGPEKGEFTAQSYVLGPVAGSHNKVPSVDALNASLSKVFELWSKKKIELRQLGHEFPEQDQEIESCLEELEKSIKLVKRYGDHDGSNDGLDRSHSVDCIPAADDSDSGSHLVEDDDSIFAKLRGCISNEKEEPHSALVRLVYFLLMPALLPLAALVGLTQDFVGGAKGRRFGALRGVWYMPLRLLNFCRFRVSTRERLASHLVALDECDAPSKTCYEFVRNNQKELAEDLVAKGEDRANVSLIINSFISEYASSFDGAQVKAFRSMAKARRSFVGSLPLLFDHESELGLNTISMFLEGDEPTKNDRRAAHLLRSMAIHLMGDRSGHDVDIAKAGGDKSLKQYRTTFASKEERDAAKTALHWLQKQGLLDLECPEDLARDVRLSYLNAAEQAILARSLHSRNPTKDVLHVLSRLLALSYALGCGFGVAAGFAALPFFSSFAAGPFVALALGMIFTFMYNWWLSKSTLPAIMGKLLPERIELIEKLYHASFWKWPWILGRSTVSAALWVTRRVMGVVLMPAVGIVAGLLLFVSGQLKQLKTEEMYTAHEAEATDRKNSFIANETVKANLGSAGPIVKASALARARVAVAGWALYFYTMRAFGLISHSRPDKIVASKDQYEYRGDQVLWFALVVVGLGLSIGFFTPAPLIVPALFVVSGFGALFYKVSHKFSRYTDAKNQKKILSPARRAVTSATVSIVLLFAVATAALALPGLDLVKPVLIDAVGLVAYTIFAQFVFLGTIVAMFSIGMIGFFEILQMKNISQSLRGFVERYLLKDGVTAPSVGSKAQESVDQKQSSTLAFVSKSLLFGGMILSGFWATWMLCVTMATQIAKSFPVFDAFPMIMSLTMLISMVGLVIKVWTALFKAVLWAMSNPALAAKSFVKSAANLIQWTFYWGPDYSSEKTWHSYGSVTSFMMGLVGVGVMLPLKMAFVLTSTLAMNFVITPIVSVFEWIIQRLPSVAALFEAEFQKADYASMQEDGLSCQSELGESTSSWWYINFTRIGNAGGNAVLNVPAATKMGNTGLMGWTLVSGWLQSFSAYFIVTSDQEPAKKVHANVRQLSGIKDDEGYQSEDEVTSLKDMTTATPVDMTTATLG